jgi:hypothetical protein
VIGWSTAELLSRHVTAESECEWLERARGTTVRELRRLVAERNGAHDGKGGVDTDDDEARGTLRVNVPREDGWVFECARKVVEAVAGPMSTDRLVQALLAEGYSTLLELVPERAGEELCAIERLECDAEHEASARAAWRAELGRWQSEAEVRCERNWEALAEADVCAKAETKAVNEERWAMATPEELDGEIRRLSGELAERDLALGIVAESAKKAEVWRRLGFASEGQYALERVGVSLSSLKAKRVLAARAGRLPELGSALASGRVGYEAAYLLSRVATAKTIAEWIRRAERRTVRHLKEEVEAVELLIRMGEGRDQAPLDEACLEPFFELERQIASGELVGVGDGKTSAASQTSGGKRSRVKRVARASAALGRVVLRWVVRRETLRFWRALEGVFRRVSSRVCRAPSSFLRFLCENFCRIWLPSLRREPCEYFELYRRDAFRCMSPVCSRRDVTPHHLRFRAHGGGDEDENVATLCVWCHLHGVHEGRIAAEPPASNVRWKIGRTGTLWVQGRERSATGLSTRRLASAARS